MMQINPSDNIVNSYLTKSSQEQQPRKVTKSDAVINELGNEVESLVQKALRVHEPDDSNLIQQAKRAIADGSLETPEAIEAVAEILLTFGI